MTLYTAQYRYSGHDRLDITVKGQDEHGKIFAPYWSMVDGYKKGTISEAQYTDMYYRMLISAYSVHSDVFLKLHKVSMQRDVTVVCFCPAGNFCHRYLLVRFMQHNWNTSYGGERSF